MEGAITQNELKTCLFKNMKPNSAPGFTVAWLRKFWFELAKLSTLAINDCYENETLTNNLKIGIIRLLRKGNKDPTITILFHRAVYFYFVIKPYRHRSLHSQENRRWRKQMVEPVSKYMM